MATVATTGVAYVAVDAAGSQVTDQPATAIVSPASTPETSLSTTTSAALDTASSAPTPQTTPGPATTATAAVASTAPWKTTTLNSAGGTIIVSYRPGEVRLESVVPAPGFAYEIKDEGPDKVDVEFEQGDEKFGLEAEWTDGGLVTEIDDD